MDFHAGVLLEVKYLHTNVIDNSTKTHLKVAENVIAMPLRLPIFSDGTELFINMEMAAKQFRQHIFVAPM